MPYLRALFQKEILGNQIGTDISLPEISKSPNEPSIKKEFKQYETGECLLDSNVVGDTVRKPPAFLNRNLTMCWLNSIAQFLLLTLTDDGPNSNLKDILFQYTLNTNICKSTQNLRRELGYKLNYLRVGQQDPFDFFEAMQLFSSDDQESIMPPMSIYTKNILTCINNSNHKSITHVTTPDPYITVDIPTDHTAIHHVIEQEFHEGSYIAEWECNQCGNIGGMKQTCIEEGMMPEFILVKLKRYGRSLNGQDYKIQTSVNPPLGFTVESGESFVQPYSLCGVLTHIGSELKSGHYIAEVRKDDQWWKCNDDKISITHFDNLSKQAYGFLFKKCKREHSFH